MKGKTVQSSRAWALVRAQHGVIARGQLLGLGYSSRAIEHRIRAGRLHPVWRGVYAVGRPELTREGRWMAALLSYAPDAVLSHETAAELWGILQPRPGPIHLSVPHSRRGDRSAIVVHRRRGLATTRTDGLPVSTPTQTLVDLATHLNRDTLEVAINQADKHDLTDPDSLRTALDAHARQPGVAQLRRTLDHRTFTLTDSQLERRFLPIAHRAGLPTPLTQQHLNGFRVDFYWPALKLVVETDGLRYHRTPTQQTRDHRRDQAHTAAGLTPLRFTHAQIHFEAPHVEAVLTAVAARQRGRGA